MLTGVITMLTRKERAVAIFNCLWFGIMPYWIYEKKCHYKGHFTYMGHLVHNLKIAKSLVLNTVPERYHNFHRSKAKYFR